ncbi:head-tail connector protein [Fusobacterium varium]|jgi:uncharacterized phage protein (predicted DNA packaging)|uniref:head-tail connector protein n=1 Tax=Fusobacterium varium TaxID=856 RepID=UPI00242DBAC7|nr:head-tail connector protein [Fusobacterium varium]MCI6031574.1 head-tail connector protein [Fusobacterium varium]MDY4005449.1 head-tail connector protein [Fusobacterium varium]
MLLGIEDVKNYLRIDYNEDDNLLQSLMVAAENYLNDAICNLEERLKEEKFKERAKILMYVIIQDWYDNRESGESKDFNYTIRSMMTQLQAGD